MRGQVPSPVEADFERPCRPLTAIGRKARAPALAAIRRQPNSRTPSRLCVGVRTRLSFEETPTLSRETVRKLKAANFKSVQGNARAGALAVEADFERPCQPLTAIVRKARAPALAAIRRQPNSRTRPRKAVDVAPHLTSRDARARPKSGGSGVRRRCGPVVRDTAC